MDLSKPLAQKALTLMAQSRYFEERVDALFQAEMLHGTTHLNIGQEAAHVALGLALRPEDWIVPTHRCHGHTLARGASMRRMFSELLGSRDGLSAGLGGSMHMSDQSTGNLGASAIVGSGVGLATGLAFALKTQESENLAVAIFGDGATSRGIVHESMNLASVWSLPVLFYCENNHYGMSSAARAMVSSLSIAERAAGYQVVSRHVDGNDFFALFAAIQEATSYIRVHQKPYFLEVETYRHCGHSRSDERCYRSPEEERAWKERDPITSFIKTVQKRELLSEEEIICLLADAQEAVREAEEAALLVKDDRLTLGETLSLVLAPEEEHSWEAGKIEGSLSYREAIREALAEEMSRDSAVHLIGEDIGRYGGCFKVTGSLYEHYAKQLHETPVSEEGFSSLAVGASQLGVRAVVELMYGDFVTLASDPIINHAAKTYYMSAGQFSAPVVFRAPIGSGTGHGGQHTQSTEALFANTPGLVLVAPATAKDAKGLLKSAIRSNNPVLFFEHKGLYDTAGEVGDSEYLVPIGKAHIVHPGSDITIVSYSKTLHTAHKAALLLAKEGISAEVIDLRTLKPLDTEAIFTSVQKTSRLLVVQESPAFGSLSSEIIAAVTGDRASFEALCAAPVRLGGAESPIPFNAELERAVVPTVEAILEAVRTIVAPR